MNRGTIVAERPRQAFWTLPAVGIVVGVLLGTAMPAVDAHTRPRLLKVTARTRRT